MEVDVVDWEDWLFEFVLMFVLVWLVVVVRWLVRVRVLMFVLTLGYMRLRMMTVRRESGGRRRVLCIVKP
jgi:hypothetical protein